MQLIIEKLSKTYPGGVLALDQISLTISKGMFGLLGPNGAGKSTLMRTIATLQNADSGTVRLGEIDVLNEKNRIRQILGYLPQEFGVYPRTSAVTLLMHLATLKGVGNGHRDRREVVETLLERVNLTDVRNKAVSTFSGGMRQRFGIAQALLRAWIRESAIVFTTFSLKSVKILLSFCRRTSCRMSKNSARKWRLLTKAVCYTAARRLTQRICLPEKSGSNR